MEETLGELGEFGLIEAVTARLPQGPHVLLGPGDDAALLAAPDRRVVASTDLLVEGRHFRRDWSTGYEIGRKAAAANLADIAAMGARPTALLIGLAAPATLPVRWALDLADGLRDECEPVGASVIGGDVVGAEAITIAVTALGDLAGREPVTRSGARPGDVLALAGRVGWSAAGLALLTLASGGDLGEVAESPLIRAHLQPEPPYDAGPAAAAGGATAMIDVSDGLVQDLGHIAAGSGVAIDVDPAALELSPLLAAAARCGVDPYDWALAGGEDHALAATFPSTAGLPYGWRRIGGVLAGGGVTVTVAGQPYRRAGGWAHFSGDAPVP
ncbi:MAG TPA: thiamine-phosphate kinase [Actinomycetes bacterium]|nr:thiamine-phosphate kinase [Actinomycetes bacterium]